jgi:2-oxoisovalerate dehydrogenase E1 component beta subunit
VIDTPIAEAGIIGAAVGAAMMGLRPIAEMQFIDFIPCGFNMLTNFAAKPHYRQGIAVPMVVRGPCGGGLAAGPYHSQNVESFFANTPGLKLVAPATVYDAKGLLKAAVRDDDPVLYFEHKALYRRLKAELPEDDYVVPIGKAALRRMGDDLTIIAYGTMAHFAVQAAEALAAEGVEAEVLDLRTLRPLDWASVEASVQRTSKILIVHEDNGFLGFGAEVAAQIGEKAFEWLDAPIRRYTAPEIPAFPFAASLEEQVMPSVAGIIERAVDLAEY